MLEVGGKSLIYCKDLCSNTDGCTAINYKAGRSEDPTSSDCVLRECPFPVKPPYSAYDAYDGHFMVLEPGDQVFNCISVNIFSSIKLNVNFIHGHRHIEHNQNLKLIQF